MNARLEAKEKLAPKPSSTLARSGFLAQEQNRNYSDDSVDITRSRKATSTSAPRSHRRDSDLALSEAAAPRFGHDFSRVNVFDERMKAKKKENPPTGDGGQFKAWGSAGGLSGLTLDVTFSVSDTPATSLQVIQTFWGTRRTDKLQVGKMTWTKDKKTYDAFVDGGKNSPYVTLGGNSPAHPTNPYYLTPDEVKSQVTFSKDAGTVRVFDRPGAVALHEEANFETAIVAVNHKGSGKDKILQAFDWGWTEKGTKPTVSKGTEIAGKASGIAVKSGVSSTFDSIVKHDYPKYTYT